MSNSCIKELSEEFLIYLESVRGLSNCSIVAYRNNLKHLMDVLGEDAPIKNVSVEDLRFCVAKLSSQKKAAASLNQFIAAVRTFFAYCKKFGYLDKNVSLELRTVRIPKHMPNFLTSTEIDELCVAPDVNELLWQTRDKALFEMMYSSGCRVSEIASLKLSQLENNNHSAIVTGKGRKDRRVYFEIDARNALNVYLLDRKKRFEKEGVQDNSGNVFVNQKGGPLSTGGIRYILSKYSGKDGIKHHVNPHALRHTFATQMLSRGADVRVVQELLGHSSISTTQRYTHITTEKLIEIYNRAHPHSK